MVACAMYTAGCFLNWGHVKPFGGRGQMEGYGWGVGAENGAAVTAFSFSPSPEAELQASNCGPLDIPGTFFRSG